jgi:hypothetical protein
MNQKLNVFGPFQKRSAPGRREFRLIQAQTLRYPGHDQPFAETLGAPIVPCGCSQRTAPYGNRSEPVPAKSRKSTRT